MVHFRMPEIVTAVPVAGDVSVMVDEVDTVALAVAMRDDFEVVELVSDVLFGHLFG